MFWFYVGRTPGKNRSLQAIGPGFPNMNLGVGSFDLRNFAIVRILFCLTPEFLLEMPKRLRVCRLDS